jgi:hypothetical protein
LFAVNVLPSAVVPLIVGAEVFDGLTAARVVAAIAAIATTAADSITRTSTDPRRVDNRPRCVVSSIL